MCQSILLYGLDVMPICVTKLKEINTRQSTLIKNAVGLNKFCRSTVLLKSLGIENVYNLSHKSTLRVNDQIKTNLTTFRLYNYLREFYKKYCPLKESFFKKLNKTIVECRVNINTTALKEQIHTAMETLKPQEHSLINYEEVDSLLEILNRPSSSTEENNAILQEINHLLKYNTAN